jgi:CspA family cold shock protein
MSSEKVATPTLGNSSPRLLGRVKWFNNKAGYGFITVSEGDRSGTDVFVHHSGIQVSNEQYKYLVQGEYVEFKVDKTEGGAHEYQAGDVSGINSGKLMCETRRDFRQTRNNHRSSGEEDDVEKGVDAKPVRMTPNTRAPREQAVSSEMPRQSTPRSSGPRARGSGPRDGTDWKLVSKGDKVKKPPSTPRPKSKAPPADA